MKKLLIILLSLSIFSKLDSQVLTLESNKHSVWLTVDNNPTIFRDEAGNSLIEMAPFFRRNRTIKKQVKSMKVEGKEYQIVLEYPRQAIYEKDGPLVATISWAGDKIHFEEEDITFKRKVRLLKGLEFYENSQGEKVLICETLKKRKYKLSLLKESTKYPTLLMALSYHQFVEAQKCFMGTNETFFPCLNF